MTETVKIEVELPKNVFDARAQCAREVMIHMDDAG